MESTLTGALGMNGSPPTTRTGGGRWTSRPRHGAPGRPGPLAARSRPGKAAQIGRGPDSLSPPG